MKHARWAILTLAVIGGALAGFSFDQGQKTQVEIWEIRLSVIKGDVFDLLVTKKR